MKDLSVTQKRCFELARVIRDGSSGLKFEMHQYMNSCGTAGCIAGHALFLYDEEFFWYCTTHDTPIRTESDRAGDLLGLTEREADYLFHNYDHTPDTAAASLEALAKEQGGV